MMSHCCLNLKNRYLSSCCFPSCSILMMLINFHLNPNPIYLNRIFLWNLNPTPRIRKNCWNYMTQTLLPMNYFHMNHVPLVYIRKWSAWESYGYSNHVDVGTHLRRNRWVTNPAQNHRGTRRLHRWWCKSAARNLLRLHIHGPPDARNLPVMIISDEICNYTIIFVWKLFNLSLLSYHYFIWCN